MENNTFQLVLCNITRSHPYLFLSLPPSLPPSCRCRQHLERERKRNKPPPTILHQNQRLNNQADNSPQHDLKNGGVRVQEVATETTSHPMQHLHNGSASSGFVEEMEHDMMLKYGQTSFNGGCTAAAGNCGSS